MSYFNYEDRQVEHECPTPLEREAREFTVGGMFFSPAGRWETITDRNPGTSMVVVTTDRGCSWTLWLSTKLPYLAQYRAGQAAYVVIHEASSVWEVVVGADRGFGYGHVLLSAGQVRGTGWQISDRPDGGSTVEQITVPSKAAARSAVKRRAKAHAKRLGIPLWADPKNTPPPAARVRVAS